MPAVRLVPTSLAAACDGLPPPLAKTLLDFLEFRQQTNAFRAGEAFLLYLVLAILMIELDPRWFRFVDVCFHL